MPESLPRLLIIEDAVAIARVLERNLSRAGFHTTVAPDGRTAFAALADGPFDFVLCDYQLPDTTGVEICRYIRASAVHRDVPIALCTAKAHEVDVAGLTVELGLTHVFFKPFSIRAITVAISEAVRSCSAAAAGPEAGE
jgi:DNA-binding response OmpR family regulator